MAKKLKYCSSCEEGFAERFAFCPVCGATLQTFELNPVTGETSPKGDIPAANLEAKSPSFEATPANDQAAVEKFNGAATEDTYIPPTEAFSHVEEHVPEAPKAEFFHNEPADDVVEATVAANFEAPVAPAFSPEPDTPAAPPAFSPEPKTPVTTAFSSAPEAPVKTFSAPAKKSWSANSLVSDGPAPAFKFPKTVSANEASTFAFVTDGAAPAFKFPKLATSDGPAPAFRLPHIKDEDYGITVINDGNSKEKNGLLLGAAIFMVTLLVALTVGSIFSKDFGVGWSGDSDISWIPDIDPVAVEEPEVKQQQKNNAGGGGGGGNEDPEPAAKGKPPAMMDKPDVAPDVNMERLTNPTVTQRVGVQGPNQAKVDADSRYGLLNGADNNSNGPGSGGGIGTGRGGGVGSGNGSGLGSGSGGGAGSGNGGGIGDGDGPGGGPPGIVEKVTTPLKIISKPKAPYTDEARQNNVQGSVTLKITFLASGQIGGVTAVTRLPYGLTEQAIAAAKQIRFEPKKVNGAPVSVTMTFQYGFNIY